MKIIPATFPQDAGEPWPDNFTWWLRPPSNYAEDLQKIIDTAQDERPIQTFFEKNPVALSLILSGGHGRWVFSKPKFGGEYVPDFILCEKNSSGYHWQLIELESPNFKVLRKDGQPTAALTHALKQITDWRVWLRKNIQYAQNQLGFIDMDSEFQSVIIIGRRKNFDEKFQSFYRELSDHRVQIMSYDRLLDRVTIAVKGLSYLNNYPEGTIFW